MYKTILSCFILGLILGSCKSKSRQINSAESRKIYQNVFGERFLIANGSFGEGRDSIEAGLWQYTSLERKYVLFGKYSNGLPAGTWTFIQSDGSALNSQWNTYSSSLMPCSFSVPFDFQDSIIDPATFKLTTINDSLGKVSIIVSIDAKPLSTVEVQKFTLETESALREQGYSMHGGMRQFDINNHSYFLDEYSLKDSLSNSSKLYRLYGNDPTNKHFVQFTLFHAGSKEDVVKTIYSLITTSLYIDNRRYLNPYVLSK